MIKAPYNFVPLNKKVFYPPWAEQVSHDIPFSDGESGEIEITITAMSPIFIRNHEINGSNYYTNKNRDKISTEFCNYNGKYYIPGSSIKGMIRNILEIMSFSRLTTENKKFAYRDFHEEKYKTKLLNNSSNIRLGWLKIENGKWKIEDLDKSNGASCRIKYENIPNGESVKSKRTAEEKYNIFGDDLSRLDTDDGIIVFTGKVGREKTREFIFPKSSKSHKVYEVDEFVVKNFKEAYYIGTLNENKLWNKYFSKWIKNGRNIPVFFLTNNDNVESFGLSLLYKLPYEYSIYDGMGEHTTDLEKIDLAETIFGYSKKIEDEDVSLKGRVQFSHCIATEVKSCNNAIAKVLSSPRAGYYPMYTKDGNTYDELHTIAGWKRYPIHQQANTQSDNDCTVDNEQTIHTCFKPLDSGTVFRGKIRYHNLRKSELGALLAALGLNEKDETLFYNIGMAKPYGFGKISISTSLNPELRYDALKVYENMMQEFDSDWHQSPQLKELLSMMKEGDDTNLEYGGYEYYGRQKADNNTREAYSEIISASDDLSYTLTDESFLEKLKKREKEEADKKEETEHKDALIQQFLPTNKALNDAIKTYIISHAIELPYFDHNHFKEYLFENFGFFDEINNGNDFINAYESLYDDEDYKKHEELFKAKYSGEIADIDKARLYKFLIEEKNNA